MLTTVTTHFDQALSIVMSGIPKRMLNNRPLYKSRLLTPSKTSCFQHKQSELQRRRTCTIRPIINLYEALSSDLLLYLLSKWVHIVDCSVSSLCGGLWRHSRASYTFFHNLPRTNVPHIVTLNYVHIYCDTSSFTYIVTQSVRKRRPSTLLASTDSARSFWKRCTICSTNSTSSTSWWNRVFLCSWIRSWPRVWMKEDRSCSCTWTTCD